MIDTLWSDFLSGASQGLIFAFALSIPCIIIGLTVKTIFRVFQKPD